jgi:hypothetical protein
MRYTAVVGLTALTLAFTAGHAHATLVSLGPGSLSGQGLGAVDTVLTMTSPANSTTESGCVAGGSGGSTVLGPTACPGSGPIGQAFAGGDEQAINNSPSAASIGLTDFNNLRILFNASEPGSDSITLGNLSLTLWDASGSILDAYYITSAVTFNSTNPGTGNAGFFFGLDSAQAGVANSLLALNPDLRLGLAANASDATGGLETFSVGVVQGEGPPSAVAEPATLGLLGVGLVAFRLVTRRRAR